MNSISPNVKVLVKVLVVDDDASIRLAVKTVVQKMGVEDVAEATNGHSALKMIEENHYDLIVSDWNMPEMGGDELLRIVKGNEKTKDTPFIMLTCRRHHDDVVSTLRAGASNYVVKPFSIQDLAQKISKIICPHPEESITGSDDDTGDKRAASLIEQIIKKLDSGQVNLPILPTVGIKIHQLLRDPELSINDIAQLVEKEPVISSKLLAISNSAFYAGVGKNDNLERAILRIGLKSVLNIVFVLINRGLYVMKHEKHEAMVKSLWEHSLACAYGAQQTAYMLRLVEPDKYFMLGLLHDIGKVVSLQVLLNMDARKWGPDNDHLISTLNQIHNEIGAFVLKKWDFDQDYIDIASCHNQEDISSDTPKELLVIYLANLLAREMGYGLKKYEGPAIVEHKSVPLLGLDPPGIEAIRGDIHRFMEGVSSQFFL
ncbi:MAG: HDOD domain-containing protein [Thermodesulfobacteriota bacterium]|nr:HDOD domain-containing protein [Thermodesulfobacteriota bacterium]